MWYDKSNEEILAIRNEWLENGSLGWKEVWENELWWGPEKKDRQRNYKRNKDIVYSQKGLGNPYKVSYSLSTYIPSFSMDSNGNVIMEWNE